MWYRALMPSHNRPGRTEADLDAELARAISESQHSRPKPDDVKNNGREPTDRVKRPPEAENPPDSTGKATTAGPGAF